MRKKFPRETLAKNYVTVSHAIQLVQGCNEHCDQLWLQQAVNSSLIDNGDRSPTEIAVNDVRSDGKQCKKREEQHNKRHARTQPKIYGGPSLFLMTYMYTF